MNTLNQPTQFSLLSAWPYIIIVFFVCLIVMVLFAAFVDYWSLRGWRMAIKEARKKRKV